MDVDIYRYYYNVERDLGTNTGPSFSFTYILLMSHGNN